MKLTMDDQKPLRYIDTGKVKIGINYQRKQPPTTFCDMEYLQKTMLPKPLGVVSEFEFPTLREILRWLVS